MPTKRKLASFMALDCQVAEENYVFMTMTYDRVVTGPVAETERV